MTIIDVNGYSIVTETVKMVSPVYNANFIGFPYVFTVYFNDDIQKTFSFETHEQASSVREMFVQKL